MYWWINTDNVVWILGLRNAETGALVTAATITAQHKLASNDTVVEDSITFSGGAGGNYVGKISKDTAMTAGLRYYLEVTEVSGGEQVLLRIHRVAGYKGA